jgi:hypothetical protein
MKRRASKGKHPFRKRGSVFRVRDPNISSEEGQYRSIQLNNLKLRSIKLGVPFDIHHSDLEWPSHCPILEIPLSRGSRAGNKNFSPSIDKIIPELGYVKGNVRVISGLANRMKQNATREELEMFCKNILPYMDGEI